MKLNPQDLEKTVDLTLKHYNPRAEDFWEGPMQVIALVEDAGVIRRILEYLGGGRLRQWNEVHSSILRAGQR